MRTDALPIAEPGAALGYAGRPTWMRRLMQGNAAPVIIVCVAIVAIWYLATVLLNVPFAREKLDRAGPYTTAQLVSAALNEDRPVL
ncbi:MAG TPA: ABC transporter permease, partial [Propylenella sp.]|nr:ABC transporter permease [Propylenella sp.]